MDMNPSEQVQASSGKTSSLHEESKFEFNSPIVKHARSYASQQSTPMTQKMHNLRLSSSVNSSVIHSHYQASVAGSSVACSG